MPRVAAVPCRWGAWQGRPMDAEARPLTDVEAEVLSRLDPEALLADLRELVACAPVGGTTGEVEVQRWCAQRLRDLGLTVREWDGEWASTVPDQLVAHGRYGVLPGEPLEDARAVFEAALAGLGDRDPWLRDHPVSVTWPGGAFAPGALPDGHPLLDQTLDAAAAAGAGRPRVEGAPYGSDLRHYAAHGIPTLQYGPGEIGRASCRERV